MVGLIEAGDGREAPLKYTRLLFEGAAEA